MQFLPIYHSESLFYPKQVTALIWLQTGSRLIVDWHHILSSSWHTKHALKMPTGCNYLQTWSPSLKQALQSQQDHMAIVLARRGFGCTVVSNNYIPQCDCSLLTRQDFKKAFCNIFFGNECTDMRLKLMSLEGKQMHVYETTKLRNNFRERRRGQILAELLQEEKSRHRTSTNQRANTPAVHLSEENTVKNADG